MHWFHVVVVVVVVVVCDMFHILLSCDKLMDLWNECMYVILLQYWHVIVTAVAVIHACKSTE